MSLKDEKDMLNKENLLDSTAGKFEATVWQDEFGLECYGTKINIRTDHQFLRSKLQKYLPLMKEKCSFDKPSEIVSIITNDAGKNGLYLSDELAMRFDSSEETSFEYAADKIVSLMAVISLPSKIYLHAGAVVWDGVGILIPGTSFAGKTTLVKEFIKAGADYYSDDCIILDDQNNMLPFPRALSIRTENGRIFKEASSFGAKNGNRRVSVNLILFSEYRANAVWQGQPVSSGESVLKLMDNFYFRPSVGNAPSEVLKTLAKLTSQTALYGGERGEASQVINWVSRKFL